jgi:zinc transport system substrate-binding protein
MTKSNASKENESMKSGLPLVCALLLSSVCALGAPARAQRLRIGVTLHPYYSYVANIVGEHADVVPLIGAQFNPHSYRPQPEDIKQLLNPATALDVLVVNGIGHDEFAFQILKGARLTGKLPLIYANDGVALIPIAGAGNDKIVNPHTFIGITSSVEQIYNIARALGKLDPAHAKIFRRNGRAYVRRLRRMKAQYMQRLCALPNLDLRCVTLHGGYDYLLQEFGLQVVSVIEPKHGLKPTAAQLAETIDKIKRQRVNVVFTELNFPDKVSNTIKAETGIRIRQLSHLTGGAYTDDCFEKGMRTNLENLTGAILEAHGKTEGAFHE